MQYAISPSTLRPVRTVYRDASSTLDEVLEEIASLRSWALDTGEQIVGLPFLRVRGTSANEVHIPVAGKVPLEPATAAGVRAGQGASGPAIALRVVQFDEVRAVMRALGPEIAAACGLNGPVEFHPSTGEFSHGTLMWPVQRHSMELGSTLAVPGRREVVQLAS